MTMSTWWTSLTEAEREQLKGDLARVLNPAIRADYDGEAEARDAYARWFVREHFLRKQFDQLHSMKVTQDDLHMYDRVQHQHGADFSTFGISIGWVENYFPNPPPSDYFVNLTDLEAAEPAQKWASKPWFKELRARYKQVRMTHDLYQTQKWLLAEAEYHRVLNEALVRSYGVDVRAP